MAAGRWEARRERRGRERRGMPPDFRGEGGEGGEGGESGEGGEGGGSEGGGSGGGEWSGVRAAAENSG